MTSLLILGLSAALMQPTFTDVFDKGDHGYAQIRIPSLIVTNQGTLLAFAEGRSGTNSDQEANKIILRRSVDNGHTWLPITVIADGGTDSLNNPCSVVESKSGRIILAYQRLPAGTKEASSKIPTGYEGPNLCTCWTVSSVDDGLTWSSPRDITRMAKHSTGATTICSGPGIGIQLTRGPHAGRLILPFNEGPFYRWNNYAVFSDNGGATWETGKNAPGAMIDGKSQVNEVQMAELSDGSVLLNSRQFAGLKVRKSALSRDGGETWSNVGNVLELNDPSCMGSIFRFSFGSSSANILLYSGPKGPDRTHGTIYLSHDDGRTWPNEKALWPGDFAYSILAKLKDGRIGILFETDGYRRIVFGSFNLDWLTNKAVSN